MTPADRIIATGGVLTFAFIGAVQALYGPLVPTFQRDFAIEAGTAGLVFTAHGSGSLCGILAPSIVRVNVLATHWLALATALLFLGATALSLAPTWPLLLTAAFVFALGSGIHVVRLNALFVAGFGRRGMAMSQLINAAFSVGAILGPLVLGATADPSPRMFRTIAMLALALFPLSVLIERKARLGVSCRNQITELGREEAPWRLLAAFVTIMCLVGGVENSIGGWTTTLALAEGYTYREAANLTALFFAAILTGRLVVVAVGHRARAGRLVIASIGAMAVLLTITTLTTAGALAFALTGLAVAPIFAATLVWVAGVLPTSRHANAVVIAGSLLGNAVFPALVGRGIAHFGERAIPPATLVLALAALVIALWLQTEVAANRGRSGGRSIT
jgi:FHS family glucose/mannose:H+ symporter-like MFS transporter